MNPRPQTVTVVIPCYNERDTWRGLVDRVVAADFAGLRPHVIVVDDGSTDGTRDALSAFVAARPRYAALPIEVHLHDSNRGKGAALQTGFAAATGDVIIVQDADLEYDPRDYPALLDPLLDDRADAVLGTRFARGRPAACPLPGYAANRALTWLTNRAYGTALTDMETCYKVFHQSFVDPSRLEQTRFGVEPELVAHLWGHGARIVEVPVGYRPRTRTAGKKIGWRDGLEAIVCIARYTPTARGRLVERSQSRRTP